MPIRRARRLDEQIVRTIATSTLGLFAQLRLQLAADSYEAGQRQPGDYEAQVSQRPIATHGLEHIGATDRGVMMFRNQTRRGIRAVQAGHDPIGLCRAPAWSSRHTVTTPSCACRRSGFGNRPSAHARSRTAARGRLPQGSAVIGIQEDPDDHSSPRISPIRIVRASETPVPPPGFLRFSVVRGRN
jgi:hypothetical protein